MFSQIKLCGFVRLM